MRAALRLVVCWLLSATAIAATPSPPFERGSLARIEARHCGRPFAIGVWSVDCPHCKDGLQRLDAGRARRPDLTLVLIQADSPAAVAAGDAVLARLAIGADERWVFSDSVPERSRHALDPHWRGETPRTYLYRADCSRIAISGPVDAALLRDWLASYPPPPGARVP